MALTSSMGGGQNLSGIAHLVMLLVYSGVDCRLVRVSRDHSILTVGGTEFPLKLRFCPLRPQMTPTYFLIHKCEEWIKLIDMYESHDQAMYYISWLYRYIA